MGGLGNQLFEIFSIFGYAFKHKDSVIFTYTPFVDNFKRRTYWETFLIGLKPFTTFNSKYNLTNENLDSLPCVKHLQHHYIELPQYPKNIITRLFGYFQSYKYFHEYRENIFRMIRLYDFQKQMKTEYSHYFEGAYTVSIHFRYGDYIVLQNHHNLLRESYYKNALSHIISTVSVDPPQKMRILYFCDKDDNRIVNKYIERFIEMYPSIEFVKIDDTIEDWKQMILMSCCDSNIIANSTYSWWGAYFNMNPTKHVCYPSHWFGPVNARNILDDMFLPSWTKVDE